MVREVVRRLIHSISLEKARFGLVLILLPILSTACSLLPESLFRDEVGVRILLEATVEVDDKTMRATRDIIEHRVEDLALEDLGDFSVGVSGNRLIVEFTVYEDDETTRELMLDTVSSVGLLEFVDFAEIPSDIGEGDCVFTTEQESILAEMQASGIEDFQWQTDCIQIGIDGTPNGPPFATVMTRSGLADVQAEIQPYGTQWEIRFTLTDEGSQIFGDHTEAHIGQRLAIVVDGVVISAPVINARIEGEGVIQGTFTRDEAEALASQLRSGRLPVPLEVIAYDVVANE